MNTNLDLRVVNYSPEPYQHSAELPISHHYLTDPFSDSREILEKIGEVVRQGDFVLGKAVATCEHMFAQRVGANSAVGVGSGTDALFLSLKALGIGPGDEVITTPFTFCATIGAIVTAGAKPVFVDVKPDYNLNESLLESAITAKTKAIIPVHWAGRPCELKAIRGIADLYQLYVVQDACHAIDALYHQQAPASFGDVTCYSLHPSKNLNAWGDGGFVCTNDEEIAHHIGLLRNHGLEDRDTCVEFAYNSRLDTLQAVVAIHFIQNRIDTITAKRINNAHYLDRALSGIPEVTCNPRDENIKEVFHLYQISCERRDELQTFLEQQGVDAKVHNPVPMHLQPAARSWGHRVGDFPGAERIARCTLSLPAHEFITEEQMDYMAAQIRRFYQ